MDEGNPPVEQVPLEVAIARVAHEVNRHYCMSLGDYSNPTWDQATPAHQESVIKGVRALLANPKLTPQAQHDMWAAEKLATGWKFGPLKSEKLKEHPCLVPYDELLPEQRSKDFIFAGVVRGIAQEQSR